MTAFLIIRAEVAEADREGFDRWYETEHLPDAKTAFDARAARRGWSDTDPSLHVAIYELPSLDRAREILGSDILKGLVVEFDRHFPQVRRTREIIGLTQTL